MASASGGQVPEQKTVLGFPMRPPGDGKAVQDARHYWYELAQEIHGAFADLDRVISGMRWSGASRTAFDARWAEFSGHGVEASQHSHEMGDHLFKVGNQIAEAQHEWDLAMGAMTASTAIGIGLTFVTFGVSDAVAEGAATAAVGTMEAICAALNVGLDAALQVLAAAIRVATQLAVKFSWQYGIDLVSQEAANMVEARGLGNLDFIQAAEFAGVSTVVPGLASRVTIGGAKVLEGASGAILTGAVTDAGVQGIEGVAEGKAFNPAEVVASGLLAGTGHTLGEDLRGVVDKKFPKPEAPQQRGASAQLDLHLELPLDPAQTRLATLKVADWGLPDVAGHTSETRVVTFENGEEGYFKPFNGEDTGGRFGFQKGTLWRNEVGVHEVDKALGFKLTATTTAVEAPIGPHGELIRGSLASSAGAPAPRGTTYDPVDQQKAAVLHYVSGNTDGHRNNVLRQPDGRPALIDGGLALTRSPADDIRSIFFPDVVGQPLDPSVVDALRRVDEADLVSRLTETGIHSDAIDGVLARLHEVQGGMISGAAHPAKLVGGPPSDWGTVPKPGP
jgi:hypothetical protein